MLILEDLLYTEDHLWVRSSEGDANAVVGITDYGQERIGPITAVDLPAAGEVITESDVLGTVENVRAEVTELLAPVSGKVREVNTAVIDQPDIVNEDPYEDGWLVELELAQPKELKDLMTAKDYAVYVEEQRLRDEEENSLEDPVEALEVEEI